MTFVMLVAVQAVSAGWWNESYMQKREHTIPAVTDIDSPFWINLINGSSMVDTESLISDSVLDSNCKDLRIVDSAESTVLPYEIDYGFCNNASTPVWASGETITSTSYANYMYSKSSSAEDAQNDSGVWQDWLGVFHMTNETSGALADSSEVDKQMSWSVGDPTYTWDALIGNATHFNGSDGWYGSDFPEYDTPNLTAVVLFKRSALTGDTQFIFSRYECYPGDCQRTWNMYMNATGNLGFSGCENKDGCSGLAINGGVIEKDKWYCAVGTANHSSVALYLWNETMHGGLNATDSLPNPIDATSADITMGYSRWSTENKDFFNGTIDEAWLANKTATADEAEHICSQMLSDENTLGTEINILNITIFSPENKTYYENRSVVLNWSADSKIDNELDWAAYSFNDSVNISFDGFENKTITPGSGDKRLRIYANDSSGIMGSETRYFRMSGVIKEDEDYGTSGFSFNNETFTLDLDVDWTFVDNYSVNFMFNGTVYSPSSSSGQVWSKSLEIPEVDSAENLTFYWNVTAYNINGSVDSFNTTLRNITVIPFGFYECTHGNVTLEIGGYNESDTAQSQEFLADIHFGIYDNTYNYSLSGNDTYRFCLNTSSTSLPGVDIDIHYKNTTTDRRFYYMRDITLDNETRYVKLYMLSKTLSTPIGFIVKDSNYEELTNVVFKALRWYPNLNQYKIVGMGLTGENGETKIYLEDNVYYKWVMERDGVVLDTTDPETLTDSTIIQYIDADVRAAYFEYYDNVAYACELDENNKQIVCEYSAPAGNFYEMRLEAREQLMFNRTDNFCTKTSVSAAGTLVCSYAGHENETIYYQLSGRMHGSGIEYPVWTNGWLTGATVSFWGDIASSTSIIAAIVIIISMSFFGAYNPKAAVVFSTFGIVVSYLFGFLQLTGPGWLIGIVTAGGLIVYMQSRGEKA